MLKYGNIGLQHYSELISIVSDCMGITIDVFGFLDVIDKKGTHPRGIDLDVVSSFRLKLVTLY